MKQTLQFFLIMLLISSEASAQTIVKNIRPGSSGSNPYPIATLPGNKTILFADDGTNAYELWISDGTTAGTNMIVNLNQTGGSLTDFGSLVYNGKMYFSGNDGTNGYELWETDGTEAGTKMVKDINPGAGHGFYGTQIILFNGKMYFRGYDATNGYELWSSDGTSSGTEIVKNINPGTASSSPAYFTVFKDKLFFAASDGTKGIEWWTSDGTVSGTVNLIDLFPGATGGAGGAGTIYNDWLYFRGIANTSDGYELFRTDGTVTEMVKNIATGAGQSSNPADFMIAGGLLYFAANDQVNGQELWKSDGTTGGTIIVKNITAGSNGTIFTTIGELNGNLIFSASTTDLGRELWVSDGTTLGTKNLLDINTGTGNGIRHVNSELYPKDGYKYFQNPYIYNGLYYFAGDDGTNGVELWQTDGTTGGTKMLNQIAPSTASSNIVWIYVGNNKVWLSATDGTTGQELFAYDIPAGALGSIRMSENLKVHPNPANSRIILDRSGDAMVFDMQGRLVLSFISEEKEQDISMLLPGMYTILIKNPDGMYSSRFSVQ